MISFNEKSGFVSGYPTERNGVNTADLNGKWATGEYLQNQLSDKYTIFSLLCRHNEFREEAQRQWKEFFEPKIEELLLEMEILYNENSVAESLICQGLKVKFRHVILYKLI